MIKRQAQQLFVFVIWGVMAALLFISGKYNVPLPNLSPEHQVMLSINMFVMMWWAVAWVSRSGSGTATIGILLTALLVMVV